MRPCKTIPAARSYQTQGTESAELKYYRSLVASAYIPKPVLTSASVPPKLLRLSHAATWGVVPDKGPPPRAPRRESFLGDWRQEENLCWVIGAKKRISQTAILVSSGITETVILTISQTPVQMEV